MKFKLATLCIALSLVLSGMQVAGVSEVYADDGDQQPAQVWPVISSGFKEYLSSLEPSDNISVTVGLKTDPKIHEQIHVIQEKYHNILTMELNRAWRTMPGIPISEAKSKVAEEVGAAAQKEIDSLEELAYSDMQKQVIGRIEQLPDTEVTVNEYSFVLLGVKTRVANIEAIAAMPNVVEIDPNMYGYSLPELVSPAQGSLGLPVDLLSFSWSFSWMPKDWSTIYRFVLATDPTFVHVAKEIDIPTNYYNYDGKLDYGMKYYWRVAAFEPDWTIWTNWSDPFSFQTEAASPAPPPEVQSKSILLSPALILVIVVTLAASAGLVTWFILARQRRIKRKSE
jgi:hypothetical protein